MRQAVSSAIIDRLPVTIQLCVMTVLLSLLIAIPLGVLAAIRRGSWLDLATGAGSAFGASMPSFWLGILLILVFAVHLKWLPAYGYVSPTEDLVGNLKTLLLPSIALATSYTAVLSRLVRASMLEVLSEDYIRTARSKGVREGAVVLRHGLRSALVPIVTVIGMETGRLLGGAVVTETVFALPGIGRLAVNAVLSRDFLTIQGVTLFMALMLLLSNLAADLLYGVVDPRIRYS
jgi:peptide/nickel transport system permease protein